MSFLRRARPDAVLMALVEEAGRNVQRCGLLLHDLLVDYPEHATLAQDLKVCEQEGDRITHDIIHRLAGAVACARRSTPATATRWRRRSTTSSTTPSRSPRSSGSTASKRRWSRRSSSPTCWSAPASRSRRRCAACARAPSSGPHLVEIHRLENEGDRLQRDGVASLFAGGIDPMVVIRWKDIFESLEAAVDACETVAHVLEGITLKQRADAERSAERGSAEACVGGALDAAAARRSRRR